MKEKRRHDVGEPTEEIIVRFMQWVKKEKTQELFFFFCLFKKLFDTYMVMDSHLKVTRRKQNQKHKKHQKKRCFKDVHVQHSAFTPSCTALRCQERNTPTYEHTI